MIWFFLGFLSGALTCASFPGFTRWVRGCAEVVGLLLQRAIAGVRPTTRNSPNIPIRARESYAKAAESASDASPQGVQWGRALSNLGGFLWKYKWALAVALIFFLLVGFLKGWSLFGPSREELRLRAELAQAEARIQGQINARDAEIARISQEAALNRQRLAYIAAQGHSEIEAARPDNETPIDERLYLAWRAGIERLRDNAGANADSAHPPGPGA